MELNRRPTLTGPTVRIRPLVEGDREALYAVAQDPGIWEQHPAERHRRAEFDSYFDEALASGGAVAIETREGDLIGASRFHDEGKGDSSIEIGWSFLARSHWGGPTNREVKSLMLDHAFGVVDRVHFVVAPDNHRSQRAVEKLGATRLDGSPHDGTVAFVLTKAEWCGTVSDLSLPGRGRTTERMSIDVVKVTGAEQIELWRQVHNAIIPTHTLSFDDVRERLTRNRLSLAYRQSEMIGNATVRPATPDGPATVIVRILAAHRRRGYGTEYWERILAQDPSLRTGDLATVVLASNEGGMRFAESRGFVEVDRYVVEGAEYVDMVRAVTVTA